MKIVNKAAFILLGALLVWPTMAAAQSDRVLLYELLNRIELLEQELRELRGDLEMYQYRQGNGGSNAEVSDLENRVVALERHLRSEPSYSAPESAPEPIIIEPPPPPSPPEPSAALPPPEPPSQPAWASLPSSPLSENEEQAYNQAVSTLRDGAYQQAIADFQRFLADYPSSSLSSEVYYWLGESYYVTRDFGQARQTLLTLGARYPDSDKIPDALLKLGYIYSELGDNNKSREVLEKLVASYPDSLAANLAQRHLQVLR